MHQTAIAPDNTQFVVLSFEGPDRYSLAGGLGARVSNLCHSLSTSGYHTHLIFVGDPKQPGEEIRNDGRLVLHRWCQWISDYYPDGLPKAVAEAMEKFIEIHGNPPPPTESIRAEVVNGDTVIVDVWTVGETT